MPKQYANPGPLTFEGTIEQFGPGMMVEFPYDLKETYGIGNLVPVKVTFDERVEYRGSLTKMRGHVVVGLRKDVREALGKSLGETLRVRVELDEQSREVAVSADLAETLASEGLREAFDALAYSHRREYADWVEGAKKPETRARRIAQVCAALASRAR